MFIKREYLLEDTTSRETENIGNSKEFEDPRPIKDDEISKKKICGITGSPKE